MALASLIAGAGLLGDSSTAVIASMLGTCINTHKFLGVLIFFVVSPLMGPILSMTFGLATMQMNIVLRGFRNEIIGILVSLLVGFLMGLIASQIYDPDFRSHEMMSRGTGEICMNYT
jgi:glucan phosphoethanolaminetransferase (alkaline phosphatase superfamily)